MNSPSIEIPKRRNPFIPQKPNSEIWLPPHRQIHPVQAAPFGILLRYGGRKFLPTDIPGLALWLDPSDATSVTIDAGAVSALADKSGNGRHFSQAVPGNRPVVASINGRAALDFNLDFLEGPSLSALTGCDSFIVAQNDVAVPELQALNHSGPGDGWMLFSGDIYDSTGTSLRKTVGPPGVGLDVARIVNVVSVAGEYTYRLSGTQLYTTVANTVDWDALRTVMGGDPINGAPWDGRIGEWLIYEAMLTTAERALVDAYLQAKWGAL